VYAFIEEEECWEEEKARGQDWQIVDFRFAVCPDLRRSYPVSMTRAKCSEKRVVHPSALDRRLRDFPSQIPPQKTYQRADSRLINSLEQL